MPRYVYAIVGLFIGAAVDLLINLLAAAIYQQPFAEQITSSIDLLIGLIVVGLLIGYWLGARLQVPINTSNQQIMDIGSITITRFRALLSYGQLRGMGIHLSDILLIGSILRVNSKDGNQK